MNDHLHVTKLKTFNYCIVKIKFPSSDVPGSLTGEGRDRTVRYTGRPYLYLGVLFNSGVTKIQNRNRLGHRMSFKRLGNVIRFGGVSVKVTE